MADCEVLAPESGAPKEPAMLWHSSAAVGSESLEGAAEAPSPLPVIGRESSALARVRARTISQNSSSC